MTGRALVAGMAAASLALLSAGCAGPASAPAIPTTTDVTGVWIGGWTASFGAGNGSATLQQAGASVTGVLVVHGAPDLDPGGPVDGAIEGDVITLVWSNRHGRSRVDFRVKGDEMSGTTFVGRAILVWRLTRANKRP